MIGQTIAHYRITGKIGAGGMGEVYRATDSKLGRDVALKILPEAFARDPERMARFQREAQVLAQLNHPNIATIYGIETEGDSAALVLELVEGPTLDERIRSGPLPAPEALLIARQMTEAIESAHEAGIIHRDLKPANVKLTPAGDVKVLDFGLAKAFEGDPTRSGPDATLGSPTMSPSFTSPVITGALTGANVILGTAAYMAPEQARAQPLDKRCDIWSFGVVLFEMLTGKLLFAGETVSDTLASVLKTDPEWDQLPADLPPAIPRLLRRCLERNPKKRLRDIGDARITLEEVLEGRSDAAEPSAAAEAGARRGFPVIPALIGAALLGAVAGVLPGVLKSGPATGDGAVPLTRLSAVTDDVRGADYQISPDGQSLLLFGSPRDPAPGEETNGFYVRRLDKYAARFIPGSRSSIAACYSPDSRWIALVGPEEVGSTAAYLWKVPVDGSAPRLKLLDWNPEWRGIHWLPDGDLVTAAWSGAMVRIPTDGSAAREPVPLITEGFELESTVRPYSSSTSRLPDGRHLLSEIEEWDERGYRLSIVAVDVQSGRVTRLIENGAEPAWSETGHLLFSRGTTLLAVPFDPGTLTVTGGPTALTNDLRIDASWSHGSFRVSRNGTLAYVRGGFVGGDRRLVRLDRNLQEIEPWSDDRLPIESALLVSPDGERVATILCDPDGVYDIWISDPGQNVLRKWLEEPGRDCFPTVWSDDGEQMVYQSRTERETLHSIRPVGGGAPVLLLEDREPGALFIAHALADQGATLLLTRFREPDVDIVTVPAAGPDAGSRPPETLLKGAKGAKMSPDGRWIAYLADRAGRWEVYVRRWMGNGEMGPERRVSTNGATGGAPYWYTPADGGPPELWYLSESTLYSVTLRGDQPIVSRPAPVAEWKDEYLMMDTLPDGGILMALRGENEGPFDRINVVLGWQQELERRLASASARD